MNRPAAVLDACVLAPLPLVDTLLRLATLELFQPFWSQLILQETFRTLRKFGYSELQVQRRIDVMVGYFPEALVEEPSGTALSPGLPDPEDNHVLATAVASRSSIVTLNLRHFPEDICGQHGVRVLHPDAFLSRLFEDEPAQVSTMLIRQAGATKRPPIAVDELLNLLSVSVPGFADLVRREIS